MKSTTTALILSFCLWATRADVRNARIIEGETSTEGKFPFAVAFYYEKAGAINLCGGSLINKKWILTAAHCVQNAESFSIYLGTNNLQNLGSNGLVINATTYVAHPNYINATLANNLGLIQLPKSVTFNERIQHIQLPSKSLKAGENAIVVGWGATKDASPLPSYTLSHVELTTITNTACMRVYGAVIRDTMVCASGEGNHGICRGDSGGGLVQTDAEGNYVLVAVANFYGRECENTYPSGFTRTFDYLEWIKNVTNSVPEDDDDNDSNSAPSDSNLLLTVTFIAVVTLKLNQ